MCKELFRIRFLEKTGWNSVNSHRWKALQVHNVWQEPLRIRLLEKKHERTHTGEKKFECCTKCDRSFFNLSLKIKATIGLTGERNNLGAPNVTTVSLSQNTERIIIGALQVLSVLWTIPHKVSWKYRRELTNLGEKPFKCTMCGKSFSKSGLTGKRNNLGAPNVTRVPLS